MGIVVIFNPGSGKRSASAVRDTVVSAMKKSDGPVTVIDCAISPDFEAVLRASASQYTKAIVLGGDGTLNGVINAILDSANPSLPVGFVPTGRGKDAARTMPAWSLAAIESSQDAIVTPFDLIRVRDQNGNQRFAMNVVSLGLGADAAEFASHAPRLMGSLAYVGGAVKHIVPPKPFRVQAKIDGFDVHIDNSLLVAICNGRSFGGGIHIAPTADPADGLLELVIAHNANLGDLLLQLPRLKRGALLDHPALSRWQATSIQLDLDTSIGAEADGEMLSIRPVHIDVVPHAINWIHPV